MFFAVCSRTVLLRLFFLVPLLSLEFKGVLEKNCRCDIKCRKSRRGGGIDGRVRSPIANPREMREFTSSTGNFNGDNEPCLFH